MSQDRLLDDETADSVAATAFAAYSRCPSKTKPTTRPDGTPEWTNLAAIVLLRATHQEQVCVALATGVKTTPDKTIRSAKGRILHDCHAEILALRAFNRFLINECLKIQENPSYLSRYIIVKNQQVTAPRSTSTGNNIKARYSLDPEWRICMVITEVPCGDASMENLGAGIEENWSSGELDETFPLRGRAYFAKLGVVRTKPGRSDAPLSLSKSCSDKLMLRQLTSAIQSPANLVIDPKNAYISTLLVPKDRLNCASFERAFGRAVGLLTSTNGNRYRDVRFRWATFRTPYEHSRDAAGEQGKPSNVSLIYVLNGSTQAEAVIKGIRMGAKTGTAASASTVSRACLAEDVVKLLQAGPADSRRTYSELKKADSERVRLKETVRQSLEGWQSTAEDEFALDERVPSERAAQDGCRAGSEATASSRPSPAKKPRKERS
ncbi:hypothetical protein BZA70DRAFT_177638 [Myxozyma melibiosi]|uniref:A to I editase domain-containing protein n=1 Tax=Myxozyma melibiosi TaxID=54550 RepID=A0ABR1F609_9ASCO